MSFCYFSTYVYNAWELLIRWAVSDRRNQQREIQEKRKEIRSQQHRISIFLQVFIWIECLFAMNVVNIYLVIAVSCHQISCWGCRASSN
jgi:uncharacterized protein YeeX (DUF496 family)